MGIMISRKPYAPFWRVGVLRGQKAGPLHGRVIGIYLPGCILWLRSGD
jgi:hypothetical protein